MKSALLTMTWLAVLSLATLAQMETIEIETPQKAKRIAGVVTDPTGYPLSEVTVEERSDDWRTVLRSTETDEHGKFHFSTSRNKKVYHLEFVRSGFKWVRITVELEKKGARSIVVSLPVGT